MKLPEFKPGQILRAAFLRWAAKHQGCTCLKDNPSSARAKTYSDLCTKTRLRCNGRFKWHRENHEEFKRGLERLVKASRAAAK